MKKRKQHFETDGHDLSGYASVDLYKNDFNSFASKIAKYNPERFDAVALKVFMKNSKPVITLYALDKMYNAAKQLPKKKFPVKKFKLNIGLNDFISNIKQFDFVVSNGKYDVNEMVVENK